VNRCQKENFLFMVQGEISEADMPTIQLGATPTRLVSDPPPSPHIFMRDALPAATLPIYPGSGQASDMLACMPSGLVNQWLGTRATQTIKYDHQHHCHHFNSGFPG